MLWSSVPSLVAETFCFVLLWNGWERRASRERVVICLVFKEALSLPQRPRA